MCNFPRAFVNSIFILQKEYFKVVFEMHYLVFLLISFSIRIRNTDVLQKQKQIPYIRLPLPQAVVIFLARL